MIRYHGRDGVRHHRNRGGGPAAGSQPHQALQAALQCLLPRRQDASLTSSSRGDHDAPQLAKHRGARTAKGDYFGPFASAGAVNRTLNTLQRAFLLRSCSDSRVRLANPPLSVVPDQALLRALRDAKSAGRTTRTGGGSRGLPPGKSRRRAKPAQDHDEGGVGAMDFEPAAKFRDRLRAMSHIQAHRASIRPFSRRPMCSRRTAKADIPASRSSSSAPDRIGATGLISRGRPRPLPAEVLGKLCRPVL